VSANKASHANSEFRGYPHSTTIRNFCTIRIPAFGSCSRVTCLLTVSKSGVVTAAKSVPGHRGGLRMGLMPGVGVGCIVFTHGRILGYRLGPSVRASHARRFGCRLRLRFLFPCLADVWPQPKGSETPDYTSVSDPFDLDPFDLWIRCRTCLVLGKSDDFLLFYAFPETKSVPQNGVN
jgi:hypothetical protein